MSAFARKLVFISAVAVAPLLATAQNAKPADPPPDDAMITEIYDIRDMASLIPAQGESPDDALNQFVSRLADHLGLQVGEIFPGLFHIDATREQHRHLMESFEHVRKLYSESYEVTVFMYDVSAGDSPSVGAPAKLESVTMLQREVIPRRTRSQISAITNRTYVASLEPIVAENAIAYTPKTQTVAEGLGLGVLIGAGAEDEKTTALRMTGELTMVSLKRSTGPDGDWRVDLPDVQVRSIQTSLRVELGKPTVAAVVAGKDSGQATVVGVTLKKVNQ